MTNDLNRSEFIGNLGKDVESKYMPNGNLVANFSIACNWKGKEQEGTEWIRLVVFGKLAEVCCKYLNKGSKVYVAGKMRTRQWEKDGQKHSQTEIVLDTLQMLDSKQDSGNQNNQGYQRKDNSQQKSGEHQRQGNSRQTAPADDLEDKDLPF